MSTKSGLNDQLQSGILKGSGRFITCIYYVDFKARSEKEKIIRFLLSQKEKITFHDGQKEQINQFRASGRNDKVLFNLALTHELFVKIGAKSPFVDEAEICDGISFWSQGKGSSKRKDNLILEKKMMIFIISGDNMREIERQLRQLREEMIRYGVYSQKKCQKEFIRSYGLHRKKPKFLLDPFGNSDGVTGEMGEEEIRNRVVHNYDSGKDGVVVTGTFLFLAKFESNLRLFLKTCDKIASEIVSNAPGTSLEEALKYAKAMVLGRFPDGSKLIKGKEPTPHYSISNFSSDPQGLLCPFAAHVRIARTAQTEDAGGIEGKIVRRGLTYTKMTGNKEASRGLYFMSYQADISKQLCPLLVNMRDKKDYMVYSQNPMNVAYLADNRGKFTFRYNEEINIDIKLQPTEFNFSSMSFRKTGYVPGYNFFESIR